MLNLAYVLHQSMRCNKPKQTVHIVTPVLLNATYGFATSFQVFPCLPLAV